MGLWMLVADPTWGHSTSTRPVPLDGPPCVLLFPRRLKKKSPSGSPTTHPNSFWPGHLLDKLRLYLPTVAQESSLALFSHVQHKPQVYPAIHHPNQWWPLRDTSDMTRVHYDCTKVYFIS